MVHLANQVGYELVHELDEGQEPARHTRRGLARCAQEHKRHDRGEAKRHDQRVDVDGGETFADLPVSHVVRDVVGGGRSRVFRAVFSSHR